MTSLKYIIRLLSGSISVLLIFVLAGCDTEATDPVIPTYVRVMDLRNFPASVNNANDPFLQSVFRLDGHYYGNPDFDTVVPKQTIDGYGDFLLGRVAHFSFNVDVTIQRTLTYSFTGLLDYYTSSNNTNSAVLFQPYLQGANTGTILNFASESEGRNVSFPNLSHRVPLAPIINGIDYFKWAKLSAGTHTVGFAKAETRFSIGQQSIIEIPGSQILNEPFITDDSYYFQPYGIYSLLLVSESSSLDKARLLHIQEDEQFTPDPNKAYIRFINAIPFTNTAADNATESLDFYVRQLDNGELSKLEGDTIQFDSRFLQSTTPERLVVIDLKRFGQNGLLPFVELDYSAYLSKRDTTANSLKQNGVPSFVFYAYRHGESEATGAIPLRKYQYVLSNVKGNWVGAAVDFDGTGFITDYILPNIPVLAQTANGYVPTVSTIVLGTEQFYSTSSGNVPFEIFTMGYSLEQAAVRQAFLDRTNRGN